MYKPRHALCSVIFTLPISFLKETGSSHFRGSDGCSGRNSVWMTSRSALFARYIQCLSSTIVVMMSSMNPSIDYFVAVISIINGYAVARWFSDCCLFSCGSKYWCGEFRYYVSQASYRSRSLPRSIAASLKVAYSSSASVVPKGNLRQRKDSSLTIAMHVDAVVVIACIRQ